jgi:hypothetical protein
MGSNPDLAGEPSALSVRLLAYPNLRVAKQQLALLREHIHRIFAIVLLREETRDSLLAPDFLPCALRVKSKVRITLFNMAIDGFGCGHRRRIVAVVDDGSRHSAED